MADPFHENRPRSHADILPSNMAALRKLDAEYLKRGIYALPEVRRFFSTVHGEGAWREEMTRAVSMRGVFWN